MYDMQEPFPIFPIAVPPLAHAPDRRGNKFPDLPITPFPHRRSRREMWETHSSTRRRPDFFLCADPTTVRSCQSSDSARPPPLPCLTDRLTSRTKALQILIRTLVMDSGDSLNHEKRPGVGDRSRILILPKVCYDWMPRTRVTWNVAVPGVPCQETFATFWFLRLCVHFLALCAPSESCSTHLAPIFISLRWPLSIGLHPRERVSKDIGLILYFTHFHVFTIRICISRY